jgi:hypothetical protein
MKSSNVHMFLKFNLLFLLPLLNNAQLTTTTTLTLPTLAAINATKNAPKTTTTSTPKLATSTFTNTVFGIIDDIVNDDDDDDELEDEFVAADEMPNSNAGYPIFSEEDDFGKLMTIANTY